MICKNCALFLTILAVAKIDLLWKMRDMKSSLWKIGRSTNLESICSKNEKGLGLPKNHFNFPSVLELFNLENGFSKVLALQDVLFKI